MTSGNEKPKTNTDKYGNNNITYSGIVVGDVEFSHEIYEEKFYTAMVKSYRTNSENFDLIPVTLSERFGDFEKVADGVFIKVIGQWRTRNVQISEEKRMLSQNLFAQTLYVVEDPSSFEYENVLKVRGFLTHKPKFRTTPLGRKISDAIIAVNRNYGKSDYIPTIIWGRGAELAANKLDVGMEIIAEGRIQSREYTKIKDGGEKEVKTVYEFSVRNLWHDDKMICGSIDRRKTPVSE